MNGDAHRLVVVGGGILGTMHAVEGVRRGWEVVQLERDDLPRGASVRNFGLLWVGGRAVGAELALALRARERWEVIAATAPGTGFRAVGSLTVARSHAELAVLEEAMRLEDAELRGYELLEAREARELNPAIKGELLGALRCRLDAVVEPRLVLAALREHLDSTGSYTWLPGREVKDVLAHAVRDQTGEVHEGDLVVCCTGASPGRALEGALDAAPLRRVRLQMLETTPVPAALTTALADGDSLRYYPAYRGEALDSLGPQDELAARWRAQLLVVQRLNGCLTIGDTHAYVEPFDFDVAEAPYEHLLGVASSLLGEPAAVERRWAGVYSEVTDPELLYYRREIEPGVVVVTGPGGRGMTMSPAIAEETFE